MYDSERLDQVIEALIGENHALYRNSAYYRHRIDLYAQMALVSAEDAAKVSPAVEADLAEKMEAERKRTPMFLVKAGDWNNARPICGYRSPDMTEDSPQVCALDPRHEGPHQATPMGV